MAEREKVIREIQYCTKDCADPGEEECNPGKCSYAVYQNSYDYDCKEMLLKDALSLLKEQEPRVLTLEELRDVGRVWESSVPPYLWLEKNRSIYNTTSFWVAWRDVYEMIHGRHDKYTDENYGNAWRVWNLQPMPEQRRDTKWEGEDDG